MPRVTSFEKKLRKGKIRNTSCRNIKKAKKFVWLLRRTTWRPFSKISTKNPVGKEMKHYFFGSFQRKVSRSNGTSEKVVPFLRTKCSKKKFVFLFVKANFNTRVGSKKKWPLSFKKFDCPSNCFNELIHMNSEVKDLRPLS